MRSCRFVLPFALLLVACNGGDGNILQGYVEAEYVDVAAGVPGRIEQLTVDNGDSVTTGQALFRLEGEIERTQAAAAEANLKIARLNLQRLKELKSGDFSSQQSLDQAKAALTVAEQEAKAATWRLGQTEQAAPAAGRISEVFYRKGEWVAAGHPVVRLLPEGSVKLRFFVPESGVGGWHLGDRVTATCDGCPKPVKATVTFIATEAEFTPPVIFSRESREKLVVMMEAKPNDAGKHLHVGQPVDVIRENP